MSLFPAYAENNSGYNISEQDVNVVNEYRCIEISGASENELLATDSEEDVVTQTPAVKNTATTTVLSDDFYIDNKLDRANLSVSTLYYPGRPDYSTCGPALGVTKPEVKRKRLRRYYDQCEPEPDLRRDIAERTAAYQRALVDTPDDASLWSDFLDFMERWGAEGVVAAAEAAAERMPRAAPLRDRYLMALRHHLPTTRYLTLLRDCLAKESDKSNRGALWVRLVAGSARAVTASELQRLVAAALRDVPEVYPRLFYIYGSYLQTAGLSEQVALLIELVVGMNFPSEKFPPPPDLEQYQRIEKELADYEDKVSCSGLPASGVWPRMERARAAGQWCRPPSSSPHRSPPVDPQRCPLPADLAELLMPVVDSTRSFLLAVHILRVAKVPMLPGTQYLERAMCGGERCECGAEGGEALLPLLTAAPAPAPAPAAAAPLLLLALDPPHYFSDEAGYLRWVNALWDALSEHMDDVRRLALNVWRLRWLTALVRVGGGGEEAARVESAARAILRRDPHPLAAAEHARLQHAAAHPRAAHTARHALALAVRLHAPSPHVLYAARVACELTASRRPLLEAVLGRELPDPIPLDAHRLALAECERQCEAVERRLLTADGLEGEGGVDGEGAHCALLPAEGEWGWARVTLAGPARRHELFERLLSMAKAAEANAALARYCEQAGEALVAAGGVAAGSRARALAPLFPRNAFLSRVSAEAPLWTSVSAGPTDALADALPALLRAAASGWRTEDSRRCARALARACSRDSGSLCWALRLVAEAHADLPTQSQFCALERYPYAKWLYVRAAENGEGAEDMPDLLLERDLRVRVLWEELHALAPAATPSAGLFPR